MKEFDVTLQKLRAKLECLEGVAKLDLIEAIDEALEVASDRKYGGGLALPRICEKLRIVCDYPDLLLDQRIAHLDGDLAKRVSASDLSLTVARWDQSERDLEGQP